MKLKRITNLRTDCDMTSTELGEKLGIPARNMQRYETGERQIPLDILIEIADYFDVSIDYLLNRTNNKKMNK